MQHLTSNLQCGMLALRAFAAARKAVRKHKRKAESAQRCLLSQSTFHCKNKKCRKLIYTENLFDYAWLLKCYDGYCRECYHEQRSPYGKFNSVKGKGAK
jgi:hypothetical protein